MDEDAKKILARWIAMQRYALSVSDDAKKVINKMFADIRKSMGADDYADFINKVTSSGKEEFVTMFTDALITGTSAYITAEAAAYGMTAPAITKKMVNDALSAPLSGQNITIKDTFDNTMRGIVIQSKAVIQRGINEGLTITQMRRQLDDIEFGTRRAMDAFSRSAINAVANNAKATMFARNTDVADRYMWSSTLDGRTSDYCKLADGKIFKVGNGPRPPAHINCRSSTVPVLVGETEAHAISRMSPRPAEKPTDKYKKGDLTTRTGRVRKARKGSQLEGTTTTARTYETWLKRQPARYQRDVIGNNGYERLKAGDTLTSILRSRNSRLNFSGLEKALN